MCIRDSWYLDETYVKVAGRWCYLYRAIDRDGPLIDSMLSEHRDRHPSYRKAIRRIGGRKAEPRTKQYLNNYTEQSHSGLKQRYCPMRGFGNFRPAAQLSAAFEAPQLHFRV